MADTPLERLRRLAEEATPGPWRFDGFGGVWRGHGDEMVLAHIHPEGHADGAFMAAADPSTVLALLDELDRYKRGAAELRRIHQMITDVQNSDAHQ